jgi:hypothetical protein
MLAVFVVALALGTKTLAAEAEPAVAIDPENHRLFLIFNARAYAASINPARQQVRTFAHMRLIGALPSATLTLAGLYRHDLVLFDNATKKVITLTPSSGHVEIVGDYSGENVFISSATIATNVAVGFDGGHRRILLFSLTSRTSRSIAIGAAAAEPLRILPATSSTIALEDLHAHAYIPLVVTPEGLDTDVGSASVPVSSSLVPHVYAGGMEILLERGALRFVSGGVSSTVTIQNPIRWTNVTTSANMVILSADDGRKLCLIPNLALVEASFEGTASTVTLHLAQLMMYLQDRDLLPTKPAVADRQYDTLLRFLSAQNVIPASNPSAAASALLSQLMRRLNNLCRWSRVFGKSVPVGKRFIVPNLDLMHDIVARPTNLAGHTFSEHLTANGVRADALDATALLDLSQSAALTVENELAKRDFQWQPQTLGTTKGQSLPCLSAINAEAATVDDLPAVLGTADPARLLSQILGRRVSSTDLRAAGLDSVEVHLSDVIVTRIPESKLIASIANCRTPAAVQQFVAATLTAGTADLRFLRKSGTQIDYAQLPRMFSDMTAPLSRNWSARIVAPIVLGTRLVDIGPADITAQSQTVRPSEGRAEELLETATGILNVPVSRWRLRVFVRDDDLANTHSAVTKLLLERRVTLTRLSDTVAAQAETSTCKTDCCGNVSWQQALAAHEQLAKEFSIASKGLGDVTSTIAITEKGQADLTHTAFFADMTLKPAWARLPTDSGPVPAPSAAQPAAPFRQPIGEDHATHIAGMLAARRGIPGLLPKAGILLIPTADLTGFVGALKTISQKSRARVINASIEFSTNDTTDHDLIRTALSDMPDRLLVVAAGNEDLDLSIGKSTLLLPLIPLAQSDLGTVISVAASNSDHTALLSWQCESAQFGQNRGRRWVDLAAPGESILAPGVGNTYTVMSGSSVAAPIVTAAAAILDAQNLSTQQIKARLIYTADYNTPIPATDLWGGVLDVKRALTNIRRTVLIERDNDVSPGRTLTLALDEDPQKPNVVTLEWPAAVDPLSPSPTKPPTSISMHNVLRISRINSTRVRIVYLDGEVFRIAEARAISGQLSCSTAQIGGDANATAANDDCLNPISLSNVQDYIAAVPRELHF